MTETVSMADTDPGDIPSKTRDRLMLMALLVLAVAVRFAFFNGAFGSDDLVYLDRSVQISGGIWSSANYNGSLRYGFNIPAGFFMYLFGINMFAANLWPLLCSITEIAAVYFLALRLWGRQAALYAALMLIFMPLHVASATRIHADPVVACFLTLSFVIFYFAEQSRSRTLYFLAGIAMGLVFWTKEIAVVTLFAFFFYPFIWRKIEPRWSYILGGGGVMLLAHLALMSFISGDPFHAFRVVMRQINHSFIQGGDAAEDGPWFYFNYLFLDIKHTWLAGIIAGASVLAIFVTCWRARKVNPGTAYVAFWLLALVAVLSFMPVSLAPLKLVMKQANYLTLFLAPMALMAGYQLANIRKVAALPILIATLGGSFLLAGLEQQAYHVFTSNSKAAVDFSRDNPGVPIVGSVNNGNIAAIYAILHQDRAVHFRYMGDMPHQAAVNNTDGNGVTPGFAVFDRETMAWGKNSVNLDKAPPCWEAVEPLVPTGFGLSHVLMGMLYRPVELLPRGARFHFKAALENLSQPSPATVYRVNMADFWCERGTVGRAHPSSN